MEDRPLVVARLEDMSATGQLQLIIQPDGDIIISVIQERRGAERIRQADVEFCTRAGGGGSPRTYAALKELLKAMFLDNMEIAKKRGSANMDIRPWFAEMPLGDEVASNDEHST